MGRQGGARRRLCARCAARTLRASLGVCARPASRAPSRSPPPPLPPRPSPPPRGAPQEGGMDGERRASARCSPARAGCRGERAREHGPAGCVRERRDEGSGGAGARHFGATGALSAKSGACACECARVRACVAVGGGVPGVLQPQTEPRAEGRESGTTARQLITHLTPRPPAPSPGPLGGPPPRRVQRLPRAWAPASPSGPARPAGRCGEDQLCRLCGRPEGASSCSAFRAAPLIREAGSVAGMSVM